MWSNTFVFRLLSFRYFKLGNWVWSQETHRVHLRAILLILIFSWWFTYQRSSSTLPWYQIISILLWERCVSEKVLFFATLKTMKKKKLLGSGNFGFSIAFLRFRLYDPVSALTIFDCFSGHLLRRFLAFFLHKIRLLKNSLILKLADSRAIISVVESAEYESQRLAREDMTSRKRITTLI